MFSVRPATTCSVRYGKQTIIVSFDRFTSLSLVFCDRPWQIFFKVNLEVLLWIFSLIRKSYTFHNFICVLLQIWRTTPSEQLYSAILSIMTSGFWAVSLFWKFGLRPTFFGFWENLLGVGLYLRNLSTWSWHRY